MVTNEMILAYVPESAFLSREEAESLAAERDQQAADVFEESVLDMQKAAEAAAHQVEIDRLIADLYNL